MHAIRPAIAAAALLCASGAQAAPAPAASSWTLSGDGGKQCRLTLHAAAGGKTAPVAMPPGCHRAFPALKGVASWSEVGDGLHLDDARGEPLLAFAVDGAGFRTTTPQGDALSLRSADGRGRAALDRAAAAAPAAVELAQASAKAAPAAKRPAAAGQKPADVAGRYAVLRDRTHDTGCMVTLDDASAAGRTLKARLAPACRDQGIVIFDPVGWEMVGGKLVLTARKGHTTELDAQEDGSWMNDPKKGKALSLKRI